MSLALATQPDAAIIEKVLIGGDLAQLTDTQRLSYYHAVCDSVGLNPLTQPFAYIHLNGKLKLYALKDATDQLRKIHGVSVQKIDKQLDADLYIVTAYVTDRTGRTDASTGAVTISALRGEARANAIMKAETKAKRRATLSICGLGMLDETEAADIPAAAPTRVTQAPAIAAAPTPETVDTTTGEVTPAPPPEWTSVTPSDQAVDAPAATERGADCHWIVRCKSGLGKRAGEVTFSDGTVATVWTDKADLYAECVAYMHAMRRVVFTLKQDKYATLKAIHPYVDPATVPF
jgi:hypothetical protein